MLKLRDNSQTTSGETPWIWLVIVFAGSVAVVAIVAAAIALGARSAKSPAGELTTTLTVEEVRYCLEKDWGGRGSYFRQTPPAASRGIARLYNGLGGVTVDLSATGKTTRITIYVREGRSLGLESKAAITDCAEGLQKALSAAG